MSKREESAGGGFISLNDAIYNTVDVRPRDHNYMFGNLWNARPSLHTVEMGCVSEAVSHKMNASKLFFQQKKQEDGMKRFGTFDGVVVHCLLTIWGIMLFLRLGWMVAHAGLIEASAIVVISLVTTIITALSLGAICTNGEVGAGGTYYLVSRSLGAPWGASIGLIFSLANAVAVALYVVGFSECVLKIAAECGMQSLTGSDTNDVRLIGAVVSLFILVLCVIGVEWVVKLDMWQLFLLLFSIFWVVLGTLIRQPSAEIHFTGYSWDTMMSNMWSNYQVDVGQQSPETFLSVFSVFFPAMTGMMAGANMSGDLKDPQKSIPKGTIISVMSSTLTYLAIVWVLGSVFTRGVVGGKGLYSNDFLMAEVSLFAPIVYAGILASTFSSALASMLGAPRILKAVCEDGVFPCLEFFAKGRDKDNEPVRGYYLAFFISLCFTMIGDINSIAPIITNFFLWNRTLINYACFAVATANAPGWRPSFQYYHPYLSLFGSVTCVVLMLALSWWSALIDMFLAFCLYRYVDKNRPDVNWGEATQGLTYVRATQSLVKLQSLPTHAKNWRPSYMVVAECEKDRSVLMDFAEQLKHGQGLVYDAKVTVGEFDDIMTEVSSRRASFNGLFGQQRKASCSAEISVPIHDTSSDMGSEKSEGIFEENIIASSFVEGVQVLLQTCGITGMRPNMLLMSYPNLQHLPEDEHRRSCTQLVNILRSALRCSFGVNVLRGIPEVPPPPPAKPTIDIWWLADTGGIALLLPHLLRLHRNWAHCDLRVFLHGRDNCCQESEAMMVRLMQLFRIRVAQVTHVDLELAPPEEAWKKYPKVACDPTSTHYSKINHFLRLNETMREHSSQASLIFVTMPYPRRTREFSPQQFIEWMEACSSDIDVPILFLRGNQTDVLTLKC